MDIAKLKILINFGNFNKFGKLDVMLSFSVSVGGRSDPRSVC